MKSIQEIADLYGVSYVAVRNWTKKGLKYEKERTLGHKERIVIDPKEVKKFLKLGRRK